MNKFKILISERISKIKQFYSKNFKKRIVITILASSFLLSFAVIIIAINYNNPIKEQEISTLDKQKDKIELIVKPNEEQDKEIEDEPQKETEEHPTEEIEDKIEVSVNDKPVYVPNTNPEPKEEEKPHVHNWVEIYRTYEAHKTTVRAFDHLPGSPEPRFIYHFGNGFECDVTDQDRDNIICAYAPKYDRESGFGAPQIPEGHPLTVSGYAAYYHQNYWLNLHYPEWQLLVAYECECGEIDDLGY